MSTRSFLRATALGFIFSRNRFEHLYHFVLLLLRPILEHRNAGRLASSPCCVVWPKAKFLFAIPYLDYPTYFSCGHRGRRRREPCCRKHPSKAKGRAIERPFNLSRHAGDDSGRSSCPGRNASFLHRAVWKSSFKNTSLWLGKRGRGRKSPRGSPVAPSVSCERVERFAHHEPIATAFPIHLFLLPYCLVAFLFVFHLDSSLLDNITKFSLFFNRYSLMPFLCSRSLASCCVDWSRSEGDHLYLGCYRIK